MNKTPIPRSENEAVSINSEMPAGELHSGELNSGELHSGEIISASSSEPSTGSASATPAGPQTEISLAPNLLGENSSPAELVAWGLQKFAGQSVVMTSSYGMEGCVLMDLCSKAIEQFGLGKLTVASIDTDFFFPETHQLQAKLETKYTNLEFVTWKTPVSVNQQAEIYGDELWKNNPNLCCNIRKVQPMQDNIHKFDVWITALRRTQTKNRADIPVLGWDWKYQLLKFCPLATWSRSDVWNYIQEHEVPFNELHLQNYPSVSCTHCTKPVPGSSPDAEIREGRWAGKEKTECGLHFSI